MSMIRRSFSLRGLALITAISMAWVTSGCGNIFTPKHKVTVDAICAAGVPKPAGQSFRLVAKRSNLGLGQVNIGVLSACVSAALAHAGMYEAPVAVAPDLVIEVSCGQESGTRADPGSRETYLDLSARPNTAKAMQRTADPEIWNVRVSIQGLSGRIETSMPLLAAVAASYTAADTRFQTQIEVPQNDASITAVREAALKTLEAKATPATAEAPPQSK